MAGTRTLAVDIGGTGIKAETLDARGKPITERERISTPKHDTAQGDRGIKKLAKACAPFERVSVGFPGVTKEGVTYTAANLGRGWTGYKFAEGCAAGCESLFASPMTLTCKVLAVLPERESSW